MEEMGQKSSSETSVYMYKSTHVDIHAVFVMAILTKIWNSSTNFILIS